MQRSALTIFSQPQLSIHLFNTGYFVVRKLNVVFYGLKLFSTQALLTISLDPISCEPVITNKDAICEGLKPSMKARGGKLEVVARGRKGHSPRDWIRLKEERRKVDIGVGQQV